MVLEPEHVAEVVRGDLDGRLADLERGFGRRTVPLLGDEDGGVGTLLLELQPEGQSGKAAAEDRDVVALGWLLIVAHAALLSLGRNGGHGDPNLDRPADNPTFKIVPRD